MTLNRLHCGAAAAAAGHLSTYMLARRVGCFGLRGLPAAGQLSLPAGDSSVTAMQTAQPLLLLFGALSWPTMGLSAGAAAAVPVAGQLLTLPAAFSAAAAP